MQPAVDLGHEVMNNVRNSVISPSELQKRENAKKRWEFVKVACIVGAVVSLIFFASIPTFYQFITTTICLFMDREIYIVADNILNILRKPLVEGWAKVSKENGYKQLGERTYVAESLIRYFDCNFENFINFFSKLDANDKYRIEWAQKCYSGEIDDYTKYK